MSSTNPFSLRIFVADGDPDGLRLVERSNWIGKAVVFPRALLPAIASNPITAKKTSGPAPFSSSPDLVSSTRPMCSFWKRAYSSWPRQPGA